MTITERMMRGGTFSLDLRDSAPKSVVDEVRAACGQLADGTFIPTDGHIAVTPGWLEPGPSVLPTAMWVGRTTKIVGRQVSGHGMGGWLGTSNAPSQTNSTGVYSATPTRTLASWVALLTTVHLSVGTVDAFGGATRTFLWTVETASEMLSAICRAFGAEWRVNPDGTIDARTVENLYGTVPAVIFSDVLGSGGVDSAGALRVVPSNVLSPTINSEQRASKTVAFGEGEGALVSRASSALETVAYALNGNVAELFREVASPTTPDTELLNVAQKVQALWRDPRTDLAISVRGDRWRTYVKPGALAYAWYPDAGVVQIGGGSVVEVSGIITLPRVVRIQQVEWSPSDGDGIYLLRRNRPVLDLTEYVVTGDGFAKVTVGSGAGENDVSESAHDAARFDKNMATAERLAR